MALLPQQFRFWLFDKLSVKTMRYVTAVPRHKATGMLGEAYQQIADDFFINGSLTSRSRVPELLAAIWTAGRETILVSGRLSRTTKEAMTATLSSINDCPYCGDMLISLVNAGDEPQAASQIFNQKEQEIEDEILRDRLLWLRKVATPGESFPDTMPFEIADMPEVLGVIMAMSDINRFSHIVMDGSPVTAPFGMQSIKAAALKIFAGELRVTHDDALPSGRSFSLLPHAKLSEDFTWAESNQYIAEALARWASTVEQQSHAVIPDAVRDLVARNLSQWQNERMPLSRNWVDEEINGLRDNERTLASFALLLAKASYQCDEKLVEDVIKIAGSQENFIRILAWCSFTAARYLTAYLAQRIISERDYSDAA